MKKLSLTLTALVLLSAITPTATVLATSTDVANVEHSQQVSSTSLTQEDIAYLESQGVSSDELGYIQNNVKDNVELRNGLITPENPYQRGKWSSAAKILIAGYKRLPAPIRAVFGYGAANSLAKFLDKFSGTLNDGLTIGLEAIGFSPGVARWLANGISWAIF